MSQSNLQARVAGGSAPIPYRAIGGLRVKTTSKGPNGARTHFVRSRDGVCQLGDEEYFIFGLLDGKSTFAEIQREFRARFAGPLSAPQFQAVLDELLEAGIVERFRSVPPAPQEPEPPRPPGRAAQALAAPDKVGREAVEAHPPPPEPVSLEAGRRGVSLLPVFLLLARLGSPLRYFAWLLVPGAALSGALLISNQLFPALGTLRAAISGRLVEAAGAVMAVLLVPWLAKGAAAAFHGAPREAFRLRMSAGIQPGLPIDNAVIATLSRKARVWSNAAPLLARLALFVIGALLGVAWGDGAGAAAGGAMIAVFGLAAFLLSATPLWPGDGRRFLAAYLATQPGPDGGASAMPARRGLDVFAAGICLLAIVGTVLVLTASSAHLVPLSAAGSAMLAAAYTAGLLWLWIARIAAEPVRASARALTSAYVRTTPVGREPVGRAEGLPPDAVGDRALSLDERLSGTAISWQSNRRAITLAITLALGIAIAFLPYPYESGGAFTVLPYDRVTLPARVSGELTEVLVREGDWVNEGGVVATLSDWTEVHSLQVAQAELEQALANLQNLLISPKPEEVELAQRQYELAMARLPFSKSDYERKLALVKTNDISVRQFELALSTYQQDQAAVNVTRANYDFVRVGPTEAQIAAARATAHREADQVAYWKDQLARTRIRATAAGQVVTPDPQLMMGQFLQEGTPFIRLEDHRVAHVEVQVPETDIREIHVGGLVRAKAWGYEHTMLLGKVVLIAPSAQPNQSIGGNVVRVVAEIPNQNGLIRADMSGYAKVETVHMPVWESFTRALTRFLLVEVWYWIP